MLKLQYFGHLMPRMDSLEKAMMAGQDWRQEEKGTTKNEVVEWHHQLDGHEFEQAPGVGDGQGSLVWCSPGGHKELHNWVTDIMFYIQCPKIPGSQLLSSRNTADKAWQ